ncbi:MAG: dipeptidase PepV [Clostridiaceae bacterium]
MKEIDVKVELLQEELIESTQRLLRIRSLEEKALPGMPFGEKVNEALEEALHIAESLGFKTVNLDGYLGYAEYGEGEDYVAVLGHLDVVPEGDGWLYPPYGAEIHEGKLYARGALDDKGPIMAALYGLKAVVDAGLTLSKRVRVIFGTNEESGSGEMFYYNQREKSPIAGFTPDADFPVIHAEKGFMVFDLAKSIESNSKRSIKVESIKGGNRANVVPDYCEAKIITDDPANVISYLSEYKYETPCDINYTRHDEGVTLKSYGVSAHGSTPEAGKNAVMQLLGFLGTLPLEDTDIGNFISFANKYIGTEIHGNSLNIGLEDEVSGKLIFNVGIINYSGSEAALTINIRYPVTYKLEDVLKPLELKLFENNIEMKNLIEDKPLYYPKDHFLVKTLQKVYEKHTGGQEEPLAIGGGTYAKTMKNIVAFGPLFPGDPDVIHQVNEYIEIDKLIQCAKIYGEAIYQLAK